MLISNNSCLSFQNIKDKRKNEIKLTLNSIFLITRNTVLGIKFGVKFRQQFDSGETKYFNLSPKWSIFTVVFRITQVVRFFFKALLQEVKAVNSLKKEKI